MNTYTESQTVGLKVLNNLYQMSWESPEFKERFINNPSIIIEEIVGHKISSDYRYHVEDQSDSSIIYLNIPPKNELDSLELSDEQLELVAGGDVIAATLIIGGICLVAGAIGCAVGYYTN
ncbi:hypothetical protein BC952_1060 [Flavobacterium limicola]|uniref:Lactobin A/cerein 7B family class IIb bacteriocin n=1 Tax=Flavobacterium limicola TaxID=180441 RepID=A0A495S8B7_9FLAO|nr:TOMM propeptide domain-containing protein [Flavobacterium limicola]RKS95388.1 hypothetical protein BC952_1060 [Flavobacterium limicola]